MQFRQLRRILQQIVIAGLPVASGGCLLEALDGGEQCVETHRKTLHENEPADPATQLKIDSCRADVDACKELCSHAMTRAELESSFPSTCDVRFLDGEVEIKVTYSVHNGGPNCPVEGRRPAGLADPNHVPARSAAGAWLAHAAWLEAASVHAFLHLAQELETHGAPRALVKLAIAAAKDEVRHTTMMTHLAKRFGGELPLVDVELPGMRTLEEIAIENAAEGCVRETWGAVLALWQSNVAQDREVRETFAAIAKDEARHAALAWAVDAWIQPQLDEAARARVAAARESAIDELRDNPRFDEALLALGLPNVEQARGLVARTYHSLWAGGVA
jgi:hypothetical protein